MFQLAVRLWVENKMLYPVKFSVMYDVANNKSSVRAFVKNDKFVSTDYMLITPFNAINGTIFEKDIVVIDGDYDKMRFVEFNLKQGVYQAINIKDEKDIVIMTCGYEYEIAGNIFEDPELVAGTKYEILQKVQKKAEPEKQAEQSKQDMAVTDNKEVVIAKREEKRESTPQKQNETKNESRSKNNENNRADKHDNQNNQNRQKKDKKNRDLNNNEKQKDVSVQNSKQPVSSIESQNNTVPEKPERQKRNGEKSERKLTEIHSASENKNENTGDMVISEHDTKKPEENPVTEDKNASTVNKLANESVIPAEEKDVFEPHDKKELAEQSSSAIESIVKEDKKRTNDVNDSSLVMEADGQMTFSEPNESDYFDEPEEKSPLKNKDDKPAKAELHFVYDCIDKKGAYVFAVTSRGMEETFFGEEENTGQKKIVLQGLVDALSYFEGNFNVTVYTDSQYVVYPFMKGWINKWKNSNWYKNETDRIQDFELWSQLLELSNKLHVKWQFVQQQTGQMTKCADILKKNMK